MVIINSNSQYPLDEGVELSSLVQKFKAVKDNNQLYSIEVWEMITSSRHCFIARPFPLNNSKKDISDCVGIGKTKEEALIECLQFIKED